VGGVNRRSDHEGRHMAKKEASEAKSSAASTTDSTVTKESSKKTTKEAELVVETASLEAAETAENVETVVTPEEDVTKAAEAAALEEQAVIEEKRDGATAKAGKRSAKAVKEAEEHLAKEARKSSGETAEAKPKQPVMPTRSRLERRSKAFRKAAENVEAGKLYNVEEAVALAKKTSTVKFDATVELHVNLGVDPRQADQNIRDNLVLPAGTGKTVRVAVFDDQKVDGADISGVEALTKQLDKGEFSFDVLIATPAQMQNLGKYARILGPRGLMPNPKSGTVTTDVAKAVAEAKAGRVEYRVDSTGIVHLGVGKVSFTPAQLSQNIQAVLTSLKANKPSSLKGIYIKSMHLTTTMGPSIKLDVAGA
jgi:ribosomal protein L1